MPSRKKPKKEKYGYTARKEKYFWSYLSVMADLRISRRTLQRWLDDLDIESLEFEDHLRVFLTLPQVTKLRDYKIVMHTRSHNLINQYRSAYETGNDRRMRAIIKEAEQHEQYEGDFDED